MRRSTADLEVTGADQQKRYPRDAGGDRVQFAAEAAAGSRLSGFLPRPRPVAPLKRRQVATYR